MCFIRNPHLTPRSAARHNERANRLLLSPEHRRTPQPQPQPPIVPMQLGHIHNNHPFLLGDDPFALPPPPPPLPPGPSPTRMRRHLEELHAQAAVAAAQLQPIARRRRGRPLQQRRVDNLPFPPPACPPSPYDLVWFLLPFLFRYLF
jgi:hypothetical protein